MTEDPDDELPDFMRNLEDELQISDDASIARGQELASKLAALDSLIKAAEDKVEAWKKERLELSRKVIPEFFLGRLKTDRIGVPAAGADVVVRPYVHANIRADWDESRRQQGFEYLEEIGLGGTVKVVMTIEFERGEIEDARALEKIVRESPYGNSHPPSMEMSVPWGTLTASVRERVSKGLKTDLEKLGATVGHEAKVVKRRG